MEHHNSNEPMSESVEMYLLRIALLQDDDRPVPISALADELSISPVSANQMCRKLEERGMVVYEPYKGVTLTPQGEAAAMRVLRKRRLWEVFLADKLGLEPSQAEDMACRLEHVTPDGLAERLASFLHNPTFSPQQKPIPTNPGGIAQRPQVSLANVAPGQEAHVTHLDAEGPALDFMRSQGLVPGVVVKVLATSTSGAMLIEAGSGQLALTPDIVRLVNVVTERTALVSPLDDEQLDAVPL